MIGRPAIPLAASAITLLAGASVAHAHGSAPVATDVQRLGAELLVSTNYGLVTIAPGQRPRLLCHDVLGPGAKWFGAGANGAVGVAHVDGFALSDDRCTFQAAKGVQGPVARLETSARGVLFLVLEGPVTDTLLRSRDGGRSFEPSLVMTGFRAGSIKPDETRSGRWVSAGVMPTGTAVIETGDDGDTWRIVLAPNGDARYRVLSTGPSGTFLGSQGATAPSLLRVDASGATSTVLELRSHPIFVTEAGAGDVWVGLTGGVLRSSRGGEAGSWASVPALGALACLRALDGLLYACPEGDGSLVALRRSVDQGARWDPFLRFDEIAGPNECPAGSVVHDLCDAQWPVDALAFGIQPAVAAPSDSPPPGGCGCGAAGLGGLAFLAFARRLRVRDAPRRSPPLGGS